MAAEKRQSKLLSISTGEYDMRKGPSHIYMEFVHNSYNNQNLLDVYLLFVSRSQGDVVTLYAHLNPPLHVLRRIILCIIDLYIST